MHGSTLVHVRALFFFFYITYLYHLCFTHEYAHRLDSSFTCAFFFCTLRKETYTDVDWVFAYYVPGGSNVRTCRALFFVLFFACNPKKGRRVFHAYCYQVRHARLIISYMLAHNVHVQLITSFLFLALHHPETYTDVVVCFFVYYVPHGSIFGTCRAFPFFFYACTSIQHIQRSTCVVCFLLPAIFSGGRGSGGGNGSIGSSSVHHCKKGACFL